MSYPLKPVLIGKPVRCKSCGNPFVLQADGVATKMATGPAPAAPAPAPAPAPARVAAAAPAPPVVPTPPPAPSATPTPAPEPAATQRPSTEARARPSTQRATKTKSEQLEKVRQEMAARLAEVGQKAADTDVAKAEDKKSERVAKPGTTPGPQPGATAKSASAKARPAAVLTGEGERHAREATRWLLGSAAVIALIAAIWLLARYESPGAAALSSFTEPIEGREAGRLGFAEVQRRRAWLAESPAMPGGLPLARDLSDAVFGPEQAVALDAAAPALRELSGLVHDAELRGWVLPEEREAARQRTGKPEQGKPAVRVIAETELRERLAIDQEAFSAVRDLLLGRHPEGGVPFAQRLIEQGKVPSRMLIRSFSGLAGDLVVGGGWTQGRSMLGPYHGLIARFEGEGWPEGWRVLRLVRGPAP